MSSSSPSGLPLPPEETPCPKDGGDCCPTGGAGSGGGAGGGGGGGGRNGGIPYPGPGGGFGGGGFGGGGFGGGDDFGDCCDEGDGASGTSPPNVADFSGNPIRYHSGQIRLVENDLASGGFGRMWGHQRIYSNQLDDNYDFGNGTNWMVRGWAYLVQVDGSEMAAVITPWQTFWFDENAGSYDPKHGIYEQLVSVTNAFELRRPDGSIWTFHDFEQTEAGLLKEVKWPGGETITITYDASNQVDKVERTDGSVTETFDYTFTSGQLSTVVWERSDGSTTDLEKCTYYYYGTSSHGNDGDLERVVREFWSGSAWGSGQTTYYRYYKDSASGTGFQHGLKLVLGPEAYGRATNPLTATDVHLKTVADYYFEYDSCATGDPRGGQRREPRLDI